MPSTSSAAECESLNNQATIVRIIVIRRDTFERRIDFVSVAQGDLQDANYFDFISFAQVS